jgi:hypothetical protein
MRITRPIAAALLLALAPLASFPPVRAQGAAEDPTTAMARARFKEGVEFYDKGEYEQARASFLQAYALKKHPAVLLNLAWSCLKSGHALEADRYFKQFLSEGKDITDKQRADANDGLTQSRARLGRIDVAAAAGTEVTIDGDRVGNAPLAEPVAVEIGAHTVKFKAPDGTTDTESITVMGGEKAVARFRATTAPPAAVAPAAPPTAAPPPSEPTAPPAQPAAPPSRNPEETVARPKNAPASDQAGAETGGASIFAPPKTAWPAIVLGSMGVAFYGVAGLFLVFKGQAQDKADQTTALIRQRLGSCAPPSRGFAAACDALSKDFSDVNSDATWGNVFLGAGIAATAGFIVYWLVADKNEETHPSARLMLSPILGPRAAGASLAGQF